MRTLLRRLAVLLAFCAALGGAVHLPHAHADEGASHSCPCLMPAASASEAPVVVETVSPVVALPCEGERPAASIPVFHAHSRAPPAA